MENPPSKPVTALAQSQLMHHSLVTADRPAEQPGVTNQERERTATPTFMPELNPFRAARNGAPEKQLALTLANMPKVACCAVV